MRYQRGTGKLVSQGWNPFAAHVIREKGLVKRINEEILEPSGYCMVVLYADETSLPHGVTIEKAEYLEQDDGLPIVIEDSQLEEVPTTEVEPEPEAITESKIDPNDFAVSKMLERRESKAQDILMMVGQEYESISVDLHSICINVKEGTERKRESILKLNNKFRIPIKFKVVEDDNGDREDGEDVE